MINKFAYRLPHASEIIRGESPYLVRGIGCDGFAVAPFKDAEHCCFTIPQEPSGYDNSVRFIPSEYGIPLASTPEKSHAAGVDNILRQIDNGKLQKAVLAKVIVRTVGIDIESTFMTLCETRPDAFVFYFSTPQTGTWLGASPELLLRRHNDRFSTMSLAGTRPAQSKGEWPEKDKTEQRIVTDFITDTFRASGLCTETGKTVTLVAGNVEHIMTPVVGTGDCDACDLLYSLSPTPALCGKPRQYAMEVLRETEGFDRGYYGGFCGPVSDLGRKFELYVNLRSSCIKNYRCCIFTGGGIVAGSEARMEWLESERKASTILQCLRQNKH